VLNDITFYAMLLKDKIFRAYDIRGVAFEDFDEDGFMAIAESFAKYLHTKFDLKKSRIFVSGDGRNSMPELFPAVITGLTMAGADVTWGGLAATPVNYFAFHEGDFDGAIQISASHNPADYNGLKLSDRNGAVCGDEIQVIRKLAQCGVCPKAAKKFGACVNDCQKTDFFVPYKHKIKSLFSESFTPKKIVIDAGNAVPGMFYPQVFRAFGFEVIELYTDLNPLFPNHQPDPERAENLQDLITIVRENKADFGLAYDGDGDRVGVVLSDGRIISADKILYILAVDYLSRNPNQPVVLDAMSSDALAQKITEAGGKVIWSKTGHSHIEHTMKAHNAELGGEQSGHFMLGENFYGHDDALLASLRFLQAVQKNPEFLTEVTNNWPEMYEFSEKIKTTDEAKFGIVDQVAAAIKKDYPAARTMDGIRVSFGDNEWAIIRCSNTSPNIAIRLEAKSTKSLEQKKKYLLGVVDRFL
jgi:phosphomannomutase/phosphoglucomutase